MADPTPVVYACRNADREIIYIGCTTRIAKRLADHRRSTPWWHEVADVETFDMPDLATARQREADAIASVRPDHNIVGVNRDRVGRCALGTKGMRKNGAKRITRQP